MDLTLSADCLYVVPQTQISAETLREYGITPSPWTHDDGTTGFALSHEEVRTLMEAGYHCTTDGNGARFAGVCPLVCRKSLAGELHTTLHGSWNGSLKPDLVLDSVEEILYPVIKKPIRVSVPHGDRMYPNTDAGHFHIWIWSSPLAGGGMGRGPERLFGHPYLRENGSIQEWDEGIPICDSEGNEAAAMDDNNLFIYYDLVHHGSDDELSILSAIFRTVVEIMVEGHKSPETDKVREQYVRYCSKRVQREKDTIGNDLKNSENQVTQLQRQLVDAIRRVEILRARAQALKSINADDRAKFVEEFDDLIKLHHIESVNIRGRTLRAYTDMIQVTDPRTDIKHDVGRMCISINMESGSVSMKNLSWQIHGMNEGMQAPHVFPNGAPCLGTLQNILPELTGKYEFPSALMVIVQYLESVNIDDPAGFHVHKWPVSKEEAEKHKIAPGVHHDSIMEAHDEVYATLTPKHVHEIELRGTLCEDAPCEDAPCEDDGCDPYQ